MKCVNCDCTVKTMNNLDCAIRGLLQRGKHVNQMMKEEKLIRDERKMEALKELKKQLPTTKKVIQCSEATMDRTVTNSTKPRRIFNKITGKAESIDFDCPSLTTEQSETTVCSSGPYTSASLSIPKKTSSVVSTTTMTTEVVATSSTFVKSKNGGSGGGAMVLDHSYWVDNDGNLESLPMKIYIKQNPVDMSLDMHLVFFDDQNQKVMDISMNSSQNKKISNVQFCGKDAKIVA